MERVRPCVEGRGAIFVEHLLCAGTLEGTKIAFELMASIFWREETENKPTIDL